MTMRPLDPKASRECGAAPHADLQALARRHQALLRRRAPWDAAWQSLADHFLPTRCRLRSQADAAEQGPLLNRRLVDATGVLAMRTLAAGLQGGLTSPARPWFRLSLDDADLARRRPVQAWLDEVAARMRAVFHRSNFYNAMHTIYGELGAFGTAFVFELADVRRGFRFLPLCAGEYALDCDADRRVDTVFRRTAMTLRQLVQTFGAEALPESLRRQARQQPEARHNVVQAVYPRTDRNPARLAARHMPVASVYWLEGREGQGRPLRESGFRAFPGFGPRWDVAGNDVYGRSPAMDALPDCRMLQQMGVTTLKAIHKAVDPPMSVAAGLRSVGLDLTPGGINYVESAPGQSPQAATPLLQVNPDLATARKAMEAVQNQIRSGLYNDLFKLILEGRSGVTASEIAAREEEKLVLIGPVLERLHDELFIPLMDRTFLCMAELDMLPPCPPELTGRRLKVEFVSLLAQAQKLVGVSATDQYLALTLKTSAAWPEALDALNVDHLLDSYADSLGLPVSLSRPLEERQQLRSARAEAARVQNLAQTLRQGVEMLQQLGKTPLTGPQGEQGTALDGLAELLRGRDNAAAPPGGRPPARRAPETPAARGDAEAR
ncbi:Bacteriophage head to tail connecting protein [Desulfovibrio legallii]|uniref:Bacteriophage head to tail connecting protein n=2 Tax=Desulfovibrio legallii TaxID=571438 RepID=A0A1G7KUM7_9BACT|nr:Bacteriophage head to tail connecting protein [Desulfovibrio legallii]